MVTAYVFVLVADGVTAADPVGYRSVFAPFCFGDGRALTSRHWRFSSVSPTDRLVALAVGDGVPVEAVGAFLLERRTLCSLSFGHLPLRWKAKERNLGLLVVLDLHDL